MCVCRGWVSWVEMGSNKQGGAGLCICALIQSPQSKTRHMCEGRINVGSRTNCAKIEH